MSHKDFEPIKEKRGFAYEDYGESHVAIENKKYTHETEIYRTPF